MSPELLIYTDLTTFPEPERSLRPLLERAPPGTVAIILRDRETPIRERLRIGQQLRKLTEAAHQGLIVADRLDLALAVGADGLHLASHGLPPSWARSAWPAPRWLSRSAHDWHSLAPAERGHLSALIASPALAPRKGRPAVGLGPLASQFADCAPILLYALGGLTPADFSQAKRAGFRGLAVLGAAYTLPADAFVLGFGWNQGT